MEVNHFEYVYDIIADEWVMRFDGHEVMRLDSWTVANELGGDDESLADTFRLICAKYILELMECEENGFFVSAVLSKLFNYGMNWSKEVK